MFRIVEEEIFLSSVLNAVEDDTAGAVVTFIGRVRNHGPERINVGNIVKIEIDSKSRMIAALRVFLLPIVALIIGFVVP
ncbi:MAG: SoxR reducing system RseC family protein, partial [Candidatus Latescibacteria bacterium]|nr:SoxR reducing system RseC family protein [Candidatus Latescibacterota bacterium]